MAKATNSKAGQAFRPRARIIRILGEELISSETVAIIELVKNAYDADASHVLIRFAAPLEEDRGCIEVIDNGHGMTLERVQTAFMEPATNDKRRRRSSRKSEKLGRRMLGEKGIGRFASSRLASELELVTRRRRAGLEVFGIFDWKQFENDDLYLDEVLILTEEREPIDICPTGAIKVLWDDDEVSVDGDMTHGTIIRMTGLKRAWNREDFVTLQRGLSRLVSPFNKVPDFSIRTELPSEMGEFSEVIAPPKLVKYPHYSVKGTVQADGSFELGYRVHALDDKRKIVKGKFAFTLDKDFSRILNLSSSDEPGDVRTPQCGPLNIELRFWDRDELGNIQQQVGSALTDIRRDLDAIAGINIHRDGFRVLPYGEPNNDWLRLDIRRVQKPQVRFSNNNIAGFVGISADDNPALTDQSNREGLDDNQAYRDFRQILITIIGDVENSRQRLRPSRKGTKSTTPTSGLFEDLNLDELRKHIAKTHPEDRRAEKIIERTQKIFSAQLEEIQTVLARYHSLATLGKLIDVVLHDGRHPLADITNQAKSGMHDVDVAAHVDNSLLSRLRKRFGSIDNQGNVLRTVFRRIEPFGGRKRGRPVQLYLEKIIANAFGVLSSQTKKLDVKVGLPRTQTLVRLDEAEIQEVLTNLLDNSLYWLQHVPASKRKIEVAVDRTAAGHVEIIFADSGPGVSPELGDRIFEPYVSNKPNGIGLGLSIAGEIIKDYYDGDLELMNRHPLGGAAFRIILKKRV